MRLLKITMKNIFFKTIFSGLSVGISCPSPEFRDFCKKYLSDASGDCDISVTVTEQDIAREIELAANSALTPYMHEITAVQRKIAEQLPFFDRLVMHGAAITYLENGYLFCAPSGTGKTTHITLWRKYLGKSVDIINGDKPFLSFGAPDAPVYVHGSPWAGKEGWNKNRSAPLRGICFISRAEENSISLVPPEKRLQLLIRQVYMPSDIKAMNKTLELMGRLISSVPVYHLHCNISEEAVRCSFEALSGSRGDNAIVFST